MRFGLYIKNHKKLNGISDYIDSINKIFSTNQINLDLVEDNDSKFDVIFIIEEFTHNINENNKFFLLKRTQGTKLCLVHTEFINKDGFFNIFNRKDLIFRRFIMVDLIYYLHKNKRNFFYQFLKSFIYFFYLIMGHIYGFRYKDISKRVYFALRDYSYRKSKHLFDFHIALSDNVYSNLKNKSKLSNIFYLQPYVDKNFIKNIKSKSKNYSILYLAGPKTPFRNDCINKLDKNNFSNFIKNKAIKKYKFFEINKNETSLDFIYSNEITVNEIFKSYQRNLEINPIGYEIYISQTENWNYLSPMRTLRSIKNNSIPLNIGQYKNSNFKLLAINVLTLDQFLLNIDNSFKEYLCNIENNTRIFNKDSDYLFFTFLKFLNNQIIYTIP